MDDRSRTWAFILYRESAPEDWLEVLEDLRIPAAVSPEHDRDVWTEADERRNPAHVAGQLKKPHRHVVLYYGSKKSAGQVLADLAELDVKHVERVHETLSYNRYLCHLDDPHKAQYPTDDLIRINGAACDIERPLTAEQRRHIKAEVTQFVRDNWITEYAELVFWCLDNRPEWSPVVMSETIYFRGLLASIRASVSHEEAHVSNRGEGADDGR